MKNIFLISAIIVTKFSFSQAPEIEWDNTIGGSGSDDLYSIDITFDGGYILAGYSGSNIFADKTEPNIGLLDYWIVKLDSLGSIEWQNTIGGDNTDKPTCIKQTSDGGFIVGGYSDSGISGDKTEANIGSYDYWILKLDSLGNIMWQNTIGGTSSDILNDIIQTKDEGYILAGSSSSEITGDKIEGNLGETDYWVVKLDSLGNITWQNTIGGNRHDGLYSIKNTLDGGYILAGYSKSDMSVDKTENCILRIDGIPTSDYWVVKIDASGNIEWDEVIGGNWDDVLIDIELCNDGSYILGGVSKSESSVDKIEDSYGLDDYWIVKINDLGVIQWQKILGGTSEDYFTAATYTFNKGYIVTGYSLSGVTGNKTDANIGVDDNWIVKLDSVGNITWQSVIGGSDYDRPLSIRQTPDGGYITGGWSSSNTSVTKSEDNIGNSDFWIIKLLPDEDCVITMFYADSDGDGFGNNLDHVLSCFLPTGYVSNNTDCNDLNAAINPVAIEICNLIDDNCNFIIDDGLPLYNYFYDGDTDGFGDLLIEIIICNDIPPTGYVIDSTDCDDTDDLIHESILYYADTDGDLYGDELNSDFFCTIFPPTGYVINNLDCNDANSLINPLSNETCNNIDDNCNSEIDEGLPTQTLFIDADGDNYGNLLIDSITCFFEIDGYVLDNTDCDDTNPDIYPGAEEISNGIDDDCNQLIDEGISINETILNSIEVYPNPTEEILFVEYADYDVATIEIINISGQILWKDNIVSALTEIDVSKFTSGIYLLKIKTSDGDVIGKFVKE